MKIIAAALVALASISLAAPANALDYDCSPLTGGCTPARVATFGVRPADGLLSAAAGVAALVPARRTIGVVVRHARASAAPVGGDNA
jgi:hypothetical protein